MAVINGTPASETLIGTAAADTITSGDGKDTVLMGGGNDLFLWSPGDYNDTIDGGTGKDTVRFTGANVPEPFNVLAIGGNVILDRLVDNVLSLDAVERVELQALGGADTIHIHQFGATDLKQVAVDLSNGTPGVGDGEVDTVTVDAGKGNDTITITQAGGVISAVGLPIQITVAGADVGNDYFEIKSQGGNDKINAATLPKALILMLDGGEGNDSITGSAGNDTLTGGDGNDTVTGGGGNDFALLGAGNDLFVSNPGDGVDNIEGGDGIDTLRGIGTGADEQISVTRTGAFVLFSGINATTQANDVERIEFRPLGGSDIVSVGDLTGTDVTAVIADLAGTSGGAAGDKKNDEVDVEGTGLDDTIKIASVGSQVVVSGLSAQVSVVHADKTDVLAISGSNGNDTIDGSKLASGKLTLLLLGGIGADTIIGSAGNDFVIGAGDKDLALLGAGNDVFTWRAGSGSDTVEGQLGTDTLRFSGAGVAENIDIAAGVGGRALVFRDVDSATLDLNDIERIELEALDGADNITVSDLSGTDVTLVTVDLGSEFGGGDLAKDTVTVAGTNGNDKITVTSPAGAMLIAGLSSQVGITGGETDKDSVTINAFGGNDIIDASKLLAGVVPLILNGGGGSDTLIGGAGTDDLFGADGNDVLSGGKGIDTLRGGAGNDLFLWGLGDGGDVVEGEGDVDTARFTGSKLDDVFVVSAIAAQTRVGASDGANLVINDVERIEIRALGGADSILVGDLAGADVTAIAVDLAGTAGGKTADTKADTVSVLATLDGTTSVTSLGSKIVVTTAQAGVSIDHWGKGDVLSLSGDFGDEVLDASALAAKSIALQVFAGLGADTVFGGAGNDQVSGGEGNDKAFLGAGNDTFIWNSGDGDDVVEGQAGLDTLLINGAGVSDTAEIRAFGDRAVFTRSLDHVVLELDDVERIEFRAADGSDFILINNLSGTDVKQVAVDLAGSGAVADGFADDVNANASDGKDNIKLSLVGGVVSIAGLSAQVTVAHATNSDRIQINALDGNDSVNASALKLSSPQLDLEGGDGNDTLIGGLGNDFVDAGEGDDKVLGGGGGDRLFGGNGKDLLDGGTGNDSLTGGAGNDVLTGGVGDDVAIGGEGDDTFTGGTGKDAMRHTSVLDGHDVFVGFDGNAAGGQDVLDLEDLFDGLNVLAADRAGRVSILDKGASVDVFVDADGIAGFELTVATLKTADVITVGQDIFVGT